MKRWWLLFVFMCVSSVGAAPTDGNPVASAPAGGAEPARRNADKPVVNLAFSYALFENVNISDAQAAVKVYAQSIGDESGFATAGVTTVLEGTNAIAEALRLKQVDLVSLTTEQFLAVEDSGLVGPLLMSSVKEQLTEQYVLLTRQESPIRTVEDLRGRRLIISSDIRASLARIWLEVLCREHGLGPADTALARILPVGKVSLVVLPVFFGQADACVVTRNGFDVMGELNPQVQKQLRVVAQSQPVVPSVSGFRRDFPEAFKQRILAAAVNSCKKRSFEQVMALFKTDRLVVQPVSVLASARELLATYHRLCASTNGPTVPLLGARLTPAGGER